MSQSYEHVSKVRAPTEIGLADEGDLEGMSDLQRRCLAAAPDGKQALLAALYTLPVLRALHEVMPSVVARRAGKVVGYSLALPPRLARDLLPELRPLFELLRGSSFRGRPLRATGFYLMGQPCLERGARGKHMCEALHAAHRKYYGGWFDCVVTEVSTSNSRSLRTLQRVGFRRVYAYREEQERWSVLAWDFQSPTERDLLARKALRALPVRRRAPAPTPMVATFAEPHLGR
ncbi:MAG: GNAT family N-acetyltransferase [Myxococcales bacterium]